jgi:tripartite ATP-independent transporter DctP family solute receptor
MFDGQSWRPLLWERAMIVCRRNLLTGAVAASAVIAAGRGRARAATRTLRIGYILPEQSQLGAGAIAFAEAVAKQTEGRISIQQFPDSALGGDVELAKGVQLGSIDLALITGFGLPGILPEIGVFNIPFLFKSVQHAHAVFDGPIGESYRQHFAAKDMVLLAWGENGLRHLTNSKRPIVTPEDLKGLRIRVPQTEVMLIAFRELGADAAALPFPQLFDALRAGKFDGEENPIATIQAAKFNQVQKFLTLSGHAYDPAAFVVSPDVFDELSTADKAAFVAAAKIGAAASRRYAAEAAVAGVIALEQGGMTIQRSIDGARFAAAMAGANAEFEKRFGRALIEQIKQAS